ncbi:MAG: helicase-related protein, partial [archaeon]|nr:helicase-related protein [archaeon]
VLGAKLIEKGGKILFLAPTKPLAEQHKKSFEKKTNIPKEKIVLLTGSTDPKERARMFKEATVINATPQTIRNDLRKGKIDLKDVKLCIFDECHRAVGDYSYVEIAARYVEQTKKPLILGLTASPGSNEEKITTVRDNLFIKNIEVKDSEDLDVKPYVKKIESEWVTVKLPADFLKVKNALERFSKEQIVLLKRMGLAPTTNIGYFSKRRQLEMQAKIRQRIGKYGKRQPSLYAAASKLAALMKASHAQLLLETQGVSTMNNYLGRMQDDEKKPTASKALKSFIKSPQIQQAIKIAEKMEVQGIEHPKLGELGKILLGQFKENPKSKAIIFNHYRSSIKTVVEYLEAVPGVKPKRFIGQATRGRDKGMSQKEQAEVIQELRNGKYNCLVASSVAEEGLDIPAVDLVVFYEPVPSEIRSIQRRGRTGRFSKGRVIILMAKDTRDEAFYWVSHHKENKMKKVLSGLKENPKEKQTKLGAW